MLNHPLSTAQKAKIILFFILLLATFIFAIIPVVVIALATSQMRRYQNFAPMESARVIVSIYYAIVMIGFAILGILNSLYVNGDEATALFVLSAMGGVMLLLSNILYFNTLKNHQNWIVAYGIFVDATDIHPYESLDNEVSTR
ncbi:MAG: hypothetical protein KU38_06930 [Sulfurovum sp. FS08-3]|nr:MAG: hypothetical protein KU38_06930 [Sulfurovum sp. FS08-3]